VREGVSTATHASKVAWVTGDSTGGVLPACVASLVDTSGHRRVAANTCLGVLHQHGPSALTLHIVIVFAWVAGNSTVGCFPHVWRPLLIQVGTGASLPAHAWGCFISVACPGPNYRTLQRIEPNVDMGCVTTHYQCLCPSRCCCCCCCCCCYEAMCVRANTRHPSGGDERSPQQASRQHTEATLLS
jgi:hypothetical protein